MPQVPYTPYPTVAPEDPATPKVSIDTPQAAFGGNIAEAVKGLGGTLSHAGDEIWHRAVALQQLRIETEVVENATKYDTETSKKFAEFESLEGKNAVEKQEEFNKYLAKTRGDFRAGLSSDYARREFDKRTLSTMAHTMFSAARHTATQNKHWVVGTYQADIAGAKRDAFQFPDDDVRFDDAVKRMEAAVDQMAAVKGVEPQVSAELKASHRQDMWAHRISGMAKVDPVTARKWENEHKADLGPSLNQVHNTVQTELRNTASRHITETVMAPVRAEREGQPEKTILQIEDEAEALAKKQLPDDKDFPVFARENARAAAIKYRSDLKDTQDHSYHTVSDWLVNPTGADTLPTKVEDISTAPKQVQAAYALLSETNKAKVRKGLLANSTIDHRDRVTYDSSPEGLTRYQQLLGMASSDSNDGRAEFLNTNMIEEKFSGKRRSELIRLQTKLSTQPEGDPRVTRAMERLQSSMGAALDNARVLSKSKDAESYYAFRGAMSLALDEWRDDPKNKGKKNPDAKEIDEMGRKVLSETTTKKNWNWPWTSKEEAGPLYQKKATESWKADFKRVLMEGGHTKEDVDQIPDYVLQREYIRDLLIKEGKKRAPK